MSKADNIINEAEQAYGVEIEIPLDILCDGGTCRHPECFCWDDFESVVDRMGREQAVKNFFRDFDLLHSDSDPDPIVLACREIELGITAAEWRAYRAEKAAKDAALTGVF